MNKRSWNIKDRAWNIYALADPRNPESLRYVGISTRKSSERLRQHIREAARGESTPKHIWIKSLLDDGVEPIMIILESSQGDNWDDRERYWVSKCRNEGHLLTNVTKGGKGAIGMTQAPESNARRSVSHKGRKFTDEHKERLSRSAKSRAPETRRLKKPSALIGRKRPKEVIDRAVKSRMASGYTHSKETREKLSKNNAMRGNPKARAKMIESRKLFIEKNKNKDILPLLDKAKSYLKDNNINPYDIGRTKLASLFKLTEGQSRRLVRKLRDAVADSPVENQNSAEMTESHTIEGDTWSVSLPGTDIHTLEDLIAFFEVDMNTWEVEKFIANRWEMGYVDAAGEARSKPLYQVKATFKKVKGLTVDAVKAEIERLKEEASAAIKKFNINKKYKHNGGGNALEISIADLHSGKLSWGEETLGPNYDHKIACKLYENAFNDLLNRTTVPLEKVCLVVGNDLFNSDSRSGTTTRGTVVNNDSRYMKNFLSVWDVLERQINTALEIAPVDVVMVSGNHDEMSVWHLGHSLECFYSGNKNVSIDNSPAYRKYWQFGKNMLMATHGNDIKLKDLPLLMATEMPQMFADTEFREIHLGHLHQERLTEQNGIRTRIIPSLSPADWWHSTNGYCNNIRAAQGFVWNCYDGLIEIKEHNIGRMTE